MCLKMPKNSKRKVSNPSGYNPHTLRQFICQENQFITDLLEKLPIPATMENDGMDPDDFVTGGPADGGRTPELPLKRTNRAKSLEELMLKLKDLQGKAPSYKNKLKKKELKNKLKKKKKNEERILNKKLARSQKPSDLKMSNLNETESETVKPNKPVFNSEGKLVFSKFDFSGIGQKDKDKREERDPKKLLKQMEKQKEKFDKLASSGEIDKVKNLQEKQAWRNALMKSQGKKVKDDISLLKKSVKRKEQIKKHSAKKWKSREDAVKKQLEDKQAKRNQNIQARKDKNKQNKMKRGVKKGRVVPGF